MLETKLHISVSIDWVEQGFSPALIAMRMSALAAEVLGAARASFFFFDFANLAVNLVSRGFGVANRRISGGVWTGGVRGRGEGWGGIRKLMLPLRN